MALALYAGDDLAEDARVSSGGAGSARITLAHNAHDRAEVDALLAAAERPGATIVKPAEDVFWRLFGLLLRSGRPRLGDRLEPAHAAPGRWRLRARRLDSFCIPRLDASAGHIGAICWDQTPFNLTNTLKEQSCLTGFSPRSIWRG